MPNRKALIAEFFGTFWLVFGGCGAAVLAAAFPAVGIGFAGVALAFGLTVLTMAYAIGHISGCHLNPAVSLGLVVGKRFPASSLLGYVIAQVVGAIAAAGVLYIIASGSASFDVHNGFACNGYGMNSPGGYSMLAGFVAEVVLTAFFLTLIHLVCIPVTNTSVNPARSTGPAIFAGGWALQELWMFWVAPLIGGALGGFIYKTLLAEPKAIGLDLREAKLTRVTTTV